MNRHNNQAVDARTCPDSTSQSALGSLYQLAFAECIPVSVVMELTLRCNLKCAHCYNFDRRSGSLPASQKMPLSRDELLRIINEVCDAGCLFLCFTGGEALTHPNLMELILHARRCHASVRIKSNGTLLTEKRCQDLAKAGVSAIDISLYGANAKTHDSFTGSRGSYYKTVRGIRNAVRAGMATKISICVTRHNVNEVSPMLAIANNLGCSADLDTEMCSRDDGTREPLYMRLSKQQYRQLLQGPMAHHLGPPDFSPERSVQCNCARSVCGISAVGDLYPCIGARISSGNLRDHSFAKLWQSSPELQRIRQLALEDFTTCKDCTLRPHCKRNSGTVWANTGNYTGTEHWTCMAAEVRREVWESAQTL